MPQTVREFAVTWLCRIPDCRGRRDPPNIEDFPTGGVAHKVHITGYLMWDDQHNQPQKDIGEVIATGGGHEYHHPWRATAWEIHPILKIEDLGQAP